MRVRYFQNQNRMAMMDGFEMGDSLRLVMEWQDENTNKKQVCENGFFINNDDDRPRRMEIRSMSVGDILDVGGEYFKCHTFGFREIGDITIPEIRIDEIHQTREMPPTNLKGESAA